MHMHMHMVKPYVHARVGQIVLECKEFHTKLSLVCCNAIEGRVYSGTRSNHGWPASTPLAPWSVPHVLQVVDAYKHLACKHPG